MRVETGKVVVAVVALLCITALVIMGHTDAATWTAGVILVLLLSDD